MSKAVMLLRDVLKMLAISLIVSIILAAILFLCGFLFGNFSVQNGFEIGKDGLLLLAALGIFLLAGMFMVKGKKLEQSKVSDSFRKHFKLIGYKTVLGIICISFISVAVIFDGFIM